MQSDEPLIALLVLVMLLVELWNRNASHSLQITANSPRIQRTSITEGHVAPPRPGDSGIGEPDRPARSLRVRTSGSGASQMAELGLGFRV